MTMKNNDVFGIQGYNLPKHEHPVYKGTLNVFPKAKGKGFTEVTASMTKGNPGPGQHDVTIKWGSPEKKVPATRKNTYIE
jgi:hypothetical protein